MKHERMWLLTTSLLTLLLILATSKILPTSPCLGNNCVTLAVGSCKYVLNYQISCIESRDQWGNKDECVHPLYFPYYCKETNRTRDVWLYQCNAPPPPGATGPHAQWMEIRTYNCGTECRAEFVTKKP